MTPPTVGQLLYAFVEDDLKAQKGLRPLSIKSYRDVLRLFLAFVAADARRRITRLALADLSFERVLGFLRHLEAERHNRPRTRNQRLAALHAFFEYLGRRVPELLPEAERVAAIPFKRVPPPETRFLEREEMSTLFASVPARGRHAARDRALLLFLYNTGARVQEVADLRAANVELGAAPRFERREDDEHRAQVGAVGRLRERHARDGHGVRDAGRALGSWRLDGCTMFVTLEPCAMCAGALVLARMDAVVFGASDPKAGFAGSLGDLVRDPRLNHRVAVRGGVLAEQASALLHAFFRERRTAPPDDPSGAAL